MLSSLDSLVLPIDMNGLAFDTLFVFVRRKCAPLFHTTLWLGDSCHQVANTHTHTYTQYNKGFSRGSHFPIAHHRYKKKVNKHVSPERVLH